MTASHTNAPLPKASLKDVLLLSYPIIISMASFSLMGLTDTLFMGWLGPTQQGAVGLGSPLAFSLISLFYGTWTGVSTFVAQAVGAKKNSYASLFMWHAALLTIPCIPVVLFLITPFAEYVLKVVNTNPEVLPQATAYLKIRLYTAPFLFVGSVALSFLRGIGDMKSPAIITFIALLTNVPFTYVLSFGAGPIPAMGVEGAALGSVIAQVVETALYIYVVLRQKNHTLYNTRTIPNLDFAIFRRFIVVSLPIGVTWILENLGWIAFTLFVATLSKEALAAHTIAYQLLNLSFMPGLALSVTAATLVGQYLGANDPKNARRCANYSLGLAIGIMGSIGLLCLLLRYPIAYLFSGDHQVVSIAAKLFVFGSIYQIFDAINLTSSGALRGAGDTRFPMVVSIVAIWFILVPSIYFFGKTLNYGIYGAWCAATGVIMLLGLVYFIRYHRGKWESMRVLSPQMLQESK